MAQGSIDRRLFLAGAAGLAVGGATLAACGGNGSKGQESSASTSSAVNSSASVSSEASPSSIKNSQSVTPAYVPYAGVKPDTPAGAHGIPAGFYHYPANPPSFTSGVPGSGGSVSCMMEGGGTTVAKSKNRWWQALNKALGVDLDLRVVPFTDYLNKFQVDVAGSLPTDLIQFVMVPQTPQVLENEFADLTPYLSGDNIKAYPGLASIPTASWQISTINGRIWGIPESRPAAGTVCAFRGDSLAKIGIKDNPPQLSNGQDFLDLCKELTDKKSSRYAIGEQPNIYVLNAALEMVGAPNGWKVQDGAFTSVYETDEMKQALDLTTQMWQAGYIHPDSFITPGKDFTWWSGGTITLYFTAFGDWQFQATAQPTWDIGAVALPKWGGGGPAAKVLGQAGYVYPMAFKKTSDSKIKELLQICDYLNAPFGTKEYLLVNWGVENVDYTLSEQGDPVRTKTGTSELIDGLEYVGTQEYVNLYVPGNKALVDMERAYLETALPNGVADPSWGLYSETAVTKGVTATQNVQNATSDIIQGRRKLAEWDSVVTSWRNLAGDAMRGEYEKAYAAQH